MQFVSVLAAAIAAFAFGAIWYMRLADPWKEASGVEIGDDGNPVNASNPVPYVIGFLGTILVAGMMRHIFSLSGIESPGSGLLAGFGIGLFLATPWLATCYGFSGRPVRLTLIDGGYATFGCTIIGLVLTLF